MAHNEAHTLPEYADTVVIGGGTAGAAIAARLAERSDRSVLLLEAGPDYGSLADGGWPSKLLDPCKMPIDDHGWNYRGSSRYGAPGLALERARVIGGCSSHNACAAVWGHREDYDGWERLGNPGWGMDDLLPLFHLANEMLRVFIPQASELTPWHQALLEAAPGAGFPVRPDMNDVDVTHGIAISPINVSQGMRWNTALAYLDPQRGRPNFTIRGNVLADRLVLEGSRVTGVDVIGPQGPTRVRAGQVVVSGGAYGSPLLLQRSGIGDPDELRALGIEPRHALPGVGRNLQEHSVILLLDPGNPELTARMQRFAAEGGLVREDAINILARSSYCKSAFDLHIYPMASREFGSWASASPEAGAWAAEKQQDGDRWLMGVGPGVLTPLSRGTVSILDRDPESAPRIDHNYFSDPDDRDLAILMDGVEIAREVMAQPGLARLVGNEHAPGISVTDRGPLGDYIRTHSSHAYHPTSSCTMGPDSDPDAVVDPRGRVHGLQGLYVGDASIMPTVPRANTNIPALVVGEKIASLLLESNRAS